ncbi:MAG: phospholipid scramblase family protein [Gemmatimonadota bacterium]|nr:phospholipid scramblase family protein [Gemmatimonadota bacterium]MDH5758972.1 phospholipid scramblase family protein [Gemmatimonadota bacterium]
MHEVLDRNLFLVKEHVGIFKAANNYDIHDPETGKVILECREEKLGWWKILRFTDFKRATPFHIQIRTPGGPDLIRVSRGWSFLRSTVPVHDGNGALLGSFRQKLLSIGGAFTVLDTDGSELCRLKGKWTGWDFRFLSGERELAHVTKKWSGLGKEMFTSADNYVLEISDSVPAGFKLRKLIMAAVMCIDMVLKE